MGEKIDKELSKGLTGAIKKIPPLAWFVVPCVLVICFFAYSLNFWLNAQATGSMLGEGAGLLAGKAIGSLEGLTQGLEEGYKAGKEEGLSAKDTTAELSGKIQKAGKLEVLVGTGTFSDILTIPDNEKDSKKVDYAALISMDYTVVFTVDLNTADIKLEDDGLHIKLDQPVVAFNPIGESRKENEYQREGIILKPGSAEDGHTAFLNSVTQMRAKATEQFQNDVPMMEAARTSAETQLRHLVNAVSFSKPETIFEWR